jgi:hypothetical protein
MMRFDLEHRRCSSFGILLFAVPGRKMDKIEQDKTKASASSAWTSENLVVSPANSLGRYAARAAIA